LNIPNSTSILKPNNTISKLRVNQFKAFLRNI